jgi:hypothetical protein
MTAPPAVLSPSSILPSASSYCLFVPTRRSSPRLSNMLDFNFFTF